MIDVQVILPPVSGDEVSTLLRFLTEELAKRKPDSIHHGCLGGEFGYGCDFETSVFKMWPYYWGDCTCGWEQRDAKWSETHTHSPECYYTDYQRLHKEIDWLSDEARHKAAAKALCEAHGIPWNNGVGCACHCDCGHQEAYKAWLKHNDHTDQCLLMVPNFHHKPSGAKAEWYKYIGRDMKIDAPAGFDWRACVTECILSASH